MQQVDEELASVLGYLRVFLVEEYTELSIYVERAEQSLQGHQIDAPVGLAPEEDGE